MSLSAMCSTAGIKQNSFRPTERQLQYESAQDLRSPTAVNTQDSICPILVELPSKRPERSTTATSITSVPTALPLSATTISLQTTREQISRLKLRILHFRHIISSKERLSDALTMTEYISSAARCLRIITT